ncbi:hypothetical protein BTO28_01420 [Domibacillus epiphyticus]|uniref:Uncharacterized protein n=1 Tax=Domibacillus epiphyticus TaxID=1714355 RepID=A0A1V2ACL2_9BACI|nr:hypothetical protein BTO28_01420 [Domibacillus epiphyticus]
MLANGISHLFQFIFFKSYVPGVITSVFIDFPYSLFTLKHLINENLLSMRKFCFFLFIGFVLQISFVLFAHMFSKLLFHYLPLFYQKLKRVLVQ